MDQQTGRVLNPDMEFYKLAGIGDIGEIIVHMDIREENDKRGVIGLGEPCAIGGIAAIANAVANAIGVRVPEVPLTPTTSAGRARKEERVMQAFEYASPSTLQEALRPAGIQVGRGGRSGGWYGPDQLDERLRPHTQACGEYQRHQGTAAASTIRAQGLRIGATVTFDELASNRCRARRVSGACTARVMGVASPQIRNMGTVGGDLCQRPRCWYYRRGFGLLAMQGRQEPGTQGDNRYHAIFGGGPAYFVSASSLGPALVALGAKVKLVSASGHATVDADKFFVTPAERIIARDRAAAERNPD